MKQALIVWGGWDGHRPREKAELIAELMRVRGFDVDLVNDLHVFRDSERLRASDLIVPIWTGGELDEESETNLLDAVAAGSGLGGFHGGLGDAFRPNVAFHFMVGGYFVATPEGMQTYRVKLVDPSHPLVHGFDDFDVQTQLLHMQVDPGNSVLATTEVESARMPWINGTVMPVAWTRQWGDGKVFYTSLGQTIADFDQPEVLEITKRGLLWATR